MKHNIHRKNGDIDRKQRGFSLVELILITAILAILCGVLVYTVPKAMCTVGIPKLDRSAPRYFGPDDSPHRREARALFQEAQPALDQEVEDDVLRDSGEEMKLIVSREEQKADRKINFNRARRKRSR